MSQYTDNEIKNNYAEIKKHLKLMQISCDNLDCVNFTSDFKSSALDLIAGYILQSAIPENMKSSILESFVEELGLSTGYSYEIYVKYKSRYSSNRYDFGQALTDYWEEYIAAIANAGSKEHIDDFAGDTITLIALIEKQTMLLSCTPQIKGTAGQYIDKVVNAIPEIDADALRDKTYRIAVDKAMGDNILELQECIDVFEALGEWRESAELRAKCVNKVMQILSKQDTEAENKCNKALQRKKKKRIRIIACVAATIITAFFVVFMLTEVPEIPNGKTEFPYNGKGNVIGAYGEYWGYIYEEKILFAYIEDLRLYKYDWREGFQVAGTMCQNKELINIFKMRSIRFEDGTKGTISYNQRTLNLKIRYKGETYLSIYYGL